MSETMYAGFAAGEAKPRYETMCTAFAAGEAEPRYETTYFRDTWMQFRGSEGEGVAKATLRPEETWKCAT